MWRRTVWHAVVHVVPSCHCCACCVLQVDKGTPVAIYAEEKEHAMAVGLTIMGTQEMRDVNKGIGVELLHHLNDGLWKTPTLN